MTKIPINRMTLKHTRENAGYSLDQMILKFKKIKDWEKGRDMPTYLQLQQLAKKYKVYTAVFFFPNSSKKKLLKYRV